MTELHSILAICVSKRASEISKPFLSHYESFLILLYVHDCVILLEVGSHDNERQEGLNNSQDLHCNLSPGVRDVNCRCHFVSLVIHQEQNVDDYDQA